MIDEKKIEEAAIKHISSNEYSSYNSGEIEDEMILCKAKNSFKAGIDWLLDNLWHPASLELKGDGRLMVETISSNGEKRITDDSRKSLYSSWQYKVSRENITRWLYIEDLMRGGK